MYGVCACSTLLWSNHWNKILWCANWVNNFIDSFIVFRSFIYLFIICIFFEIEIFETRDSVRTVAKIKRVFVPHKVNAAATIVIAVANIKGKSSLEIFDLEKVSKLEIAFEIRIERKKILFNRKIEFKVFSCCENSLWIENIARQTTTWSEKFSIELICNVHNHSWVDQTRGFSESYSFDRMKHRVKFRMNSVLFSIFTPKE